MNRINFSKNWVGKLEHEFFSTVRLFTQEKYVYYELLENELFEVCLNKKVFCESELVFVKKVSLLDCLNFGLNYTDAGLNPFEFYSLMKRFYGKKEGWNDMNTELILLIFKKNDLGQKQKLVKA